MKKFCYCLPIVLVSSVFGQVAYAKCDIGEFKDHYNNSRILELNVHFLNLIDRETYEEAQSSGKLKSLLAGASGFFRTDASYDAFQQRRSQYFEKIEFTTSQNLSESYVGNFLSDRGLQAYRACVEDRHNGLFLHTDKVTDEYIDIRIVWRKPYGGDDVIELRPVLENGSFIEGAPTSIAHQEEKLLRIEREPNAEVYLKIGSNAGQEVARSYPKQFAYPSKVKVFRVRFWSGNSGEYFDANSVYVDDIWTVDTPLEKQYSEVLREVSHAGPLYVSAEVKTNEQYFVNIVRVNHRTVASTPRRSGKGRTSLINCNTPIPCNYHATIELLND